MSEEVAKVEAEVSESQTAQTSDEKEPEVTEQTQESPKDENAKVEDEAAAGEDGAEPPVKEKPKEEEKPQLSDPEEPEDDVPIALVTGASGYLASHIVKQLLEQGRFRVRGTVRSLENETKVKPLREFVPEPRYPLRLIEADLLKPQSWKEAVRRCSYVFHIASPLALSNPKNPDVVVKPAVEGTTNVLKACSETGTVKRVVLTSSTVTIVPLAGDPEKPKDHVYTELDWANDATCSVYEKSKVRAEKAAWEFVKELDESKRFELVTICPGLLAGPILCPSHKEGSVGLILQILTGKTSRFPDVYFLVTDVRESAAAHIAALEKPEAAGNRYIAFTESMSMKAIAQVLAEEFKPQGYKVGSKGMSKAVIWAAKFINSGAKMTYQMLGKQMNLSNEKMKGELGIQPRPVKETLIDVAYSAIEIGVVEKKPRYLGHPSTRPPPEEKPEEPEAAAEQTTTEEPKKEEAEPASSEPTKTEETSSEPVKGDEPKAVSEQTEPAVDQPKAAEEPPSEQKPPEEPASEPAVTEEPPAASEEPPSEQPPSEQAATEEPSSEPPATEEPPSEPPATEDPPSEPPATEEPPSEPPATEEPPSVPPATEEPPSEPPATEEPPSEQTATEEPPSEEPATEEPPSEPPSEPPATEEPPSEPPATEEPPSEPPATEEAAEAEEQAETEIEADSEKPDNKPDEPDQQPPSEPTQDES